MARPMIVTGYIPIMGHPRTAKEYGELGEQIFGRLAFDGPKVRFFEKVEDTWLYKLVKKRGLPVGWSGGDNEQKNTLAYHYVQHQKFGWLIKAMLEDKEADPLVWIDYGIGHVPGVTAAVIDDFLSKVRENDFAIPGIWSRDGLVVNDLFPCWRFCGGAMVVPRQNVVQLYLSAKSEVRRNLNETGRITWEVNTLARIEPFLPKLRWYPSDHNETMFTNYGETLCNVASSLPELADQSAPTSTLQ